ncbi:hypothetical protein [Saccharolobus islandicus]|uniref:Uncharacterized protein n=3 Tax=Saccharolobus islandicus TaxID=43080 RepID=M9UFQ8_SACIS|nr:hypothetical protein [Sulfolobus islandicus]ADX83049.1 conserved hypothetical protein [Sulfolobus islandicus HVE10/4]ADX85685.1 conserved hypothetical protein [Sulfolobus islandicus REY15A]AGJ63060.1 Hypothetical Protein SiL_1614 [Sulfolobus islandicus LAL14/1]WCM38168.1 hypothetical protein GO599_12400 [Sulfolobus islandicus]
MFYLMHLDPLYLILTNIILLSKKFIYKHGLHNVMSVNLRKVLVTGFISLFVILMLILPITLAQSQTVTNITLVPTGFITIPTTSSSASFTAYVINNNPNSETVTVYLNGNSYTTVTIPPYSYSPVTLSLPTGKNVLTVNGQSLIITVNSVSKVVSANILLNNSANLILINGISGKLYTVNLTISNIRNWNTSVSTYTYSSVFLTNMYRLYNAPFELQPPLSNSSYVPILVPSYVSQGLYYFYNYIQFYNISNYRQVLGYVPFVIFVNVSYGLNGTLVTSNTYTSNNITVSFVTTNGYIYILSKYPFSLSDKVIVEVLPQSSSLKPFTTAIGNFTSTLTINGQPIQEPYFGSNSTEFAYGNSWIELKIPEQYTGTQYQINITYITPHGIVSTGLIPTITSTTTTTTTSTTSTTSSTTTTTTTSTTTASTTTTSSSTTTTTTSTSTSSTTTISTTSTTSTSTTSTTTPTTSSSTTTSVTSSGISTPVIIGIVIVIIVIVVAAVVLLRRR